MNKLISLILLVFFPFVSLRRYHEYRYTREEEAKKALVYSALGIISFSLFDVGVRYVEGIWKYVVLALGLTIYFLAMSGFIRVNARLNSDTPV